MDDEEKASSAGDSPRFEGDDGPDLIVAALDHFRGVLSADGSSYWKEGFARQEAHLCEWAAGLGLTLEAEDLLPKLRRGGQEHDVYHDEARDRIVKVTRNNVFGLTPGIELALVPEEEDARRFHLWEATPYLYLERLRLQNLIAPGLNRLEGVCRHGDQLAIVISQPRLELLYASSAEIDEWFSGLGFRKVTSAGFYRAEDNLGVFDAHDKNVVHDELRGELIPFDVIPMNPDGGFLEFIEETLDRGEQLRAERSTHTAAFST